MRLGHAELSACVGVTPALVSTVDVEDDLVRGDGYGAWTCWLRQGDRVVLTDTVTAEAWRSRCRRWPCST